MTTVRLRHIAAVNPSCPAFDKLAHHNDLTFLPMEAVWPDGLLDLSQRRPKRAVATGYTRFQDGDVLVPKITPTFEAGRSVLITGLLNGVGAGTTELHVLRPGPRLDPHFLLHLVNTHDFLKLGKSQMYGVAGQQRVPDDFLRNLTVDLPNLEEQRRIADFLDSESSRIYQVLKARRQQLQLLNHRRAAQLAHCVTYNQPDAVHHKTLGSISPDWPILPLRRILPAINVGVVINPSTYFTNEGAPFIHGFNVRDGWISQNGMKFMTHENNRLLNRSRVHKGDVLVVRAGATSGRAAAVPQRYDGANCASVLILRKSQSISPHYLVSFFNSSIGKGQVQTSQYGAAQEVISAGQVSSFSIALPSLSEQLDRVTELHARTVATDSLESSLKRQLAVLAERRQALITAAVTGQFDVTTARGVDVS